MTKVEVRKTKSGYEVYFRGGLWRFTRPGTFINDDKEEQKFDYGVKYAKAGKFPIPIPFDALDVLIKAIHTNSEIREFLAEFERAND